MIAPKFNENQLIFVAERVQKENDKWQEIVIEIVDTPTVFGREIQFSSIVFLAYFTDNTSIQY